MERRISDLNHACNVIGGDDLGGPVTAALNPNEDRNSSWLNIDRFSDSHLAFEESAAENEYPKMGNIEAKSGSGVAKDDEADDGAQEMDNNVNGAEDGHGVEGGVEHGGKDVIADPKMNADAEGWCYPRASFLSDLTLRFQESRIRHKPKVFKL